jgi:hypothetical protein
MREQLCLKKNCPKKGIWINYGNINTCLCYNHYLEWDQIYEWINYGNINTCLCYNHYLEWDQIYEEIECQEYPERMHQIIDMFMLWSLG